MENFTSAKQMNNQVEAINTLGSDRPDVAKAIAKKKLTFKEVKDSFFKFLYQAGIPFSHGNKLYIVTDFEDKKEGNIYNVRAGYYTANCKLENISVDGKPIYVVLLSSTYGDLELRQKNKLKLLSKTHNLVIFDKSDWSSFNNIEDKEWLKPLTKSILKRWAKVLFERIGELNGVVKSKYNLHDIYERIDQNYNESFKKQAIEALSDQNKQLKYQLRVSLFSQVLEVKEHHYPIIEQLSKVNESATEWIEKCMASLIKAFKNKKLLVADEALVFDVFEKEIFKEVRKDIRELELVTLAESLYSLKSTKTFQSFNVFVGFQSPVQGIKIPKLALEKLDSKVIYGIILEKKDKAVPVRILSAIFLKDSFNKETANYCLFTPNRLLYNYESGLDRKYSLCLPKLNQL